MQPSNTTTIAVNSVSRWGRRRGITVHRNTLVAFAALSLAAISVLPADAATFTNGEFVTHNPQQYGTLRGSPEDPSIDALVEDNFNTVLAPGTGLFQVGIPGPAGFSIIFDSADAVIAYLPGGGAPGPLTADLLDPVSALTPFLGGEVVAATINVDLSYAGVLKHPPGVAFGDLKFQQLDSLIGDIIFVGQTVPFGPEIAELDGVPVHEALSEADLYLGGAASPFTDYELLEVLQIANFSFVDGRVGEFASYLTPPPPTPPSVPEPSAWATLLVGLAGLTFAGWRSSGRDKHVQR